MASNRSPNPEITRDANSSICCVIIILSSNSEPLTISTRFANAHPALGTTELRVRAAQNPIGLLLSQVFSFSPCKQPANSQAPVRTLVQAARSVIPQAGSLCL